MADGITRNGDDRDNTFFGTARDDRLFGNGGNDRLYGRAGDDVLAGSVGADLLNGNQGADSLFGGHGNDQIHGGFGDDIIFAGNGNDRIDFNVTTDGSDKVDLGGGSDVVNVDADTAGQVRLTFTSSEVGNNDGFDSDTMMNQDGGLAVRLRAENGSGGLTGPVSRFGDENVTFVAARTGLTFDVRDLVSGTERGDFFEVVTLGSDNDDRLTAVQNGRSYYINAGMGDDVVTGGSQADFLVGGAGNDTLSGRAGDDSFIGGGGNDRIFGGDGMDTAIFNVSKDGSDRVDLGAGMDVVRVSADVPGQVRLTFTSSEVGDGSGLDSDAMANQDGGLAVRLQAEGGSDSLVGPVSRFGDEGITYVSTTEGLTFDVRDLVSGAARGDQFEVVRLGTRGNDLLNSVETGRPYYINGGMGNDTINGGARADFLVGGAGNDTLSGFRGNDAFIGGGGNDSLAGGVGQDQFIFAAPLDAATNVDTINGFSHVDDTIRLDDMVFDTLQPGPLNPEAFAFFGAPTEADDRIIYNRDTGDLFYDENGGARTDAVLFARLVNSPNNVDSTDFVVV